MILEFLIEWGYAIGRDGFTIIFLCFLIYLTCCFIEEVRKDRKWQLERLKNKNKGYYD